MPAWKMGRLLLQRSGLRLSHAVSLLVHRTLGSWEGVEAPVLVRVTAPGEPAGLGPSPIPERGLRLQTVRGRNPGFVRTAGPRLCSFPLRIVPGFRTSYQRSAEVQCSYPHSLGQPTPIRQSTLGLEPQHWELGACSSSLGLPLLPPSTPQAS